ncbi:hypothetical protein NDU88_001786 [Pleurodeles waltl]|uniref:Uncharacterized protein n=1 Tax=Pleurodeles waltl TaxID=8319 RepID=A0AAV7NEE5_PLEWA|nr:hypothetical protein NDU88_001786 [Pleurodeles waltl]
MSRGRGLADQQDGHHTVRLCSAGDPNAAFLLILQHLTLTHHLCRCRGDRGVCRLEAGPGRTHGAYGPQPLLSASWLGAPGVSAEGSGFFNCTRSILLPRLACWGRGGSRGPPLHHLQPQGPLGTRIGPQATARVPRIAGVGDPLCCWRPHTLQTRLIPTPGSPGSWWGPPASRTDVPDIQSSRAQSSAKSGRGPSQRGRTAPALRLGALFCALWNCRLSDWAADALRLWRTLWDSRRCRSPSAPPPHLGSALHISPGTPFFVSHVDCWRQQFYCMALCLADLLCSGYSGWLLKLRRPP